RWPTPTPMLPAQGNEGREPVIWFDGLDSPIGRYLEALTQQRHRQDRQPVGKLVGSSERCFGAAGLLPVRASGSVGPARLLHYRWDTAYAALLQLAEVEANPFDDVILEYVDTTTGRSLFPTMGCYLQMIRPRAHTRAHRQTSSGVYHGIRGAGRTVIDGVRYEWKQGDFFVVPPNALHAHVNDENDPAILFSVQDVPLLRALGLYREEE